MRLSVIGSGYVGLVTGACLADSGNDVVSCDRDPQKIADLKAGKSPIFEPGLEELIQINSAAGRLRFTTDIKEAVHNIEVIFIAVGTPPREDGSPDLSAIWAVGEEIAQHLDGPKIVVIKSTVSVGTGDELQRQINEKAAHPVQVVNNPEFLKEGTAVEDFLKPDRVVIGSADQAAGDIIHELHEPFVRNQKPIFHMPRAAAEMTKYAANAFLSTKISFINQIACICDELGIDVNDVRRGMGSDARIGFQFLYPGAGYGGSCFPKDVQALVHVAKRANVESDLLQAVHDVNQRQRMFLFKKVADRFGDSLKDRCIAIWGIAFKPKTDDIREAPAVTLVQQLLQAGARVRAHDPEALQNLEKQFGNDRVTYHKNAYEALEGADALAVVTEWNEFRSPDFDRMRTQLKQPIIFDGRNIYSLKTMRQRGFEYYSIGRPSVKP